MSKRHEPGTNSHKKDAPKHRVSRGLSPSTMGGVLFGGVMGAALGPAGAIAGVVIGGLAGEAVDRHGEAERRAESELPA
jgi:hypothetical protein